MFNKFSLLAGVVVVFVATSASAQIATAYGTSGVGNGGVVEITVQGSIVSSVQLEVQGSGATVLAPTSSPGGALATGTLDFGSFSTQTVPTGVTNATFKARTAANDGAVVAGTIGAKLTYSGATTGSIFLQRKAAGTIPVGNLLFGAAGNAWAGGAAAGTPVEIAGPVDVCGGNCVSGTAYPHDLAVFVPDTQSAGLFSTVVTYTGTAL